MSSPFDLPEPNFIDRDPQAIVDAMVAKFEADTARTLYPAQAERLMVNQVAYREFLIREAVQDAAKQNLLAYARTPTILHLGAFVGVAPLAAQPAKTVLRFIFPAAFALPVVVPSGVRCANGDGGTVFATSVAATLTVGETQVDIQATCETTGIVGNGWASGQIAQLLDDIGVVGIRIINLTTSAGGAEAESTESLRLRISEAPEGFSTAGPAGAYRFWARSAHPSIIDVYPRKHFPYPGHVTLYVLTEDGQADLVVLDAVLTTCSDETVRPLCDTVIAAAPERVEFAIEVRLTLYNGSDAPTALALWQTAVDVYRNARASKLGQDIVRWQIETLVQGAGVYRADVVAPIADIPVAGWQWAVCTSARVTLAGYAGG